MRTPTLIATLAAGLVLTACGGGAAETASTPAAASELTVVATEFAFEPADLRLPADQDVAVALENAGVVEHDITVDELDLEIYAAAGETTTGTINAPAGSYAYYCSIPGHRQAGMEGTLTVE
jgi:plastocyanin